MHQPRRQHNPSQIKCTIHGCQRWFKNGSGRTKHIRTFHAPQSAMSSRSCHPPTVSHPPPPRAGHLPPSDLASSDISMNEGSSDQNSFERSSRPNSPIQLNSPGYHPSSPSFSPHLRSRSSSIEPMPNNRNLKDSLSEVRHPLINGQPCDEQGNYLPPNSPPPQPRHGPAANDWTPYRNRAEFETAEFLYSRTQMSASNIDTLLDLWASTLLNHDDTPPFADHSDLYNTIDSTPIGDVPWQSFSLKYHEELPDGAVPQWMTEEYEVWFRDPHLIIKNMIRNPDYDGGFDTAPLQIFDSNGDRVYQNFMSGDWVSEEADKIAEDPNTHGAMLVPIILGSDKTTVSVATGHNEYYPLYASIGPIHNNIRRAHRGGVALIAFLAIPKTDKSHTNDVKFRKFRRQLFHSSLSKILETLKPGMTIPEIVQCFDNHFRRVIYSIGPYIADYPEQALLTCIVQGWCPRCTAKLNDLDERGGRRSREHTELLVSELELGVLWEEYGLVGDVVPFTNDFPRADIHQLIAPDLLHQIVKGVFKDHLVDWVCKYLVKTHGQTHANLILDDIDQRIAVAPPFSGLRRFPQGRGFKQWTGDDSKALMKVYLPAIEGYVPSRILRTFRAFLEFCYIARHNVITERTLAELQDAVTRFHHHRTIFKELGIRQDGFALPRQHSIIHYFALIQAFGAPNGLCSSITESKHITAIKKPWRRSSRYNALGQMLLTNQRLDKLAAARVDFTNRGMLNGTCLSNALEDIETLHRGSEKDTDDIDQPAIPDGDEDDIDDGPTVLAHVELARSIRQKYTVIDLAKEIDQPQLPKLIQQFLYDQLYCDSHLTSADVSLNACPTFSGTISVFSSAAATYYAPSDPSGVGGMHREHIRATPSWRRGPARYDCAFVNSRPEVEGMRGLDVVRILLLFSFVFKNVTYPCALVHWFSFVGDEFDEDTGMWMVQPDISDGSPVVSVIHLDCIFRAAHLLPVYGDDPIPKTISSHNSLDVFKTFYVNKYADHHSFEIAS